MLLSFYLDLGKKALSHVQKKKRSPAMLSAVFLLSRTTGLFPLSTLAVCERPPSFSISSFLCHLPQKNWRSKKESSSDGERVVDALSVDLGALEPALVADGDVGDVEVAAGDRGGDEVVAEGGREIGFFSEEEKNEFFPPLCFLSLSPSKETKKSQNSNLK